MSQPVAKFKHNMANNCPVVSVEQDCAGLVLSSARVVFTGRHSVVTMCSVDTKSYPVRGSEHVRTCCHSAPIYLLYKTAAVGLLLVFTHNIASHTCTDTPHQALASHTHLRAGMHGALLDALQMRCSMACHRDPSLGEMYALVRSQRLLEGRLRALAHQVSDANLQQMPDFQLRVEVLRRLEYIAADNTVQLKVCLELISADNSMHGRVDIRQC